jgi:hypothetical protein
MVCLLGCVCVCVWGGGGGGGSDFLFFKNFPGPSRLGGLHRKISSEPYFHAPFR